MQTTPINSGYLPPSSQLAADFVAPFGVVEFVELVQEEPVEPVEPVELAAEVERGLEPF